MVAEIVSLADRRKDRLDPVLAQVEAYWDGLRCGRSAPSRAEVDPRGLTGVLKHCFILERIAPGMGRFRVAGQHLCDLMGLEMRGMPFSTIFTPDARDTLEDVLERVMTTPLTMRLAIRSVERPGKEPVSGQLLLLPLRSDLGEMTRVLGCMVMDADPITAPRRLDITATSPRAIPAGKDISTRPASTQPEDAQDRPGGDVVELTLPSD